MEPKRIREGYLVKKGSMFSTWKPMWVVLLEDGIEFYKKKSDNSPKGMIPLKGSTLASPCQDFGKRMFVWKITTTKQQDHFFQAAFLEERDAWVRDIKKAIKCIEGGQKFARKSTRRSIRLPETVDLGALYLSMKDTEKGIKELNLEKDKKVFNHCFTGNGVIDWLVSNKLVRNRQEGLMIAASLLSEGYLQPAGDLSKNAADGIAENPFLDNPDAFYFFPDSGFFCEENSSDDDVILREEFRGVIIKQGCLLKQGHRRKNWKVRKFVLREDPAYLHYYDPAGCRSSCASWTSKNSAGGEHQGSGEDPLGAVHLRGCVVTSVESNPDGKKSDDENLFEIITADEVHYYLQAATPKERTEWIKAIQVASRTGK
ncbi:pleckstrin isoform X1 [Onychomys torridus]|uniref:pleckstrin isoform X1 n=1 Tax=Onychomys torridus TaxID=38674 RepID=UPI00167FBC71|nr:pleckstrin isoform X1 [Onychomys torridus]